MRGGVRASAEVWVSYGLLFFIFCFTCLHEGL